jgi:hypothetical protein
MELTLKTSWEGVTIKEYMLYLGALHNPNTSDFEKQLDILAVMCGISREDLMPLPANQILPLFNRLTFLTIPPTADVRPYYDISGRKFKFCMDVKELTAGQFIDITNYTRDPDLILDNLNAICAVLLLPVKPYKGKRLEPPCEKYGETPLQEIADYLYEHMPIQEAMGISNFFGFLYSVFTEITRLYLEAEQTKQLNKASKMLKMLPKLKAQ